MEEETLKQIFVALGRIEGNSKATRNDIKEIKEKIESNCKRINNIENKQSKAEGKAGILASIVAIVISTVSYWFFKD